MWGAAASTEIKAEREGRRISGKVGGVVSGASYS